MRFGSISTFHEQFCWECCASLAIVPSQKMTAEYSWTWWSQNCLEVNWKRSIWINTRKCADDAVREFLCIIGAFCFGRMGGMNYWNMGWEAIFCRMCKLRNEVFYVFEVTTKFAFVFKTFQPIITSHSLFYAKGVFVKFSIISLRHIFKSVKSLNAFQISTWKTNKNSENT